MLRLSLVALLLSLVCGCAHVRVTDPELCVETIDPPGLDRPVPERQAAQDPSDQLLAPSTAP